MSKRRFPLPTFPRSVIARSFAGFFAGAILNVSAFAADEPVVPAAPVTAPAAPTAKPEPKPNPKKDTKPDESAALRVENDITYTTRQNPSGPVDLKMNVFSPPDADAQTKPGARPCIVILHGGGWSAGKREEMTNIAKFFAKKGYVAAAVTYRLAPECLAPAQMYDTAQAVRFLRANAARFGIDPERVVSLGFSAGGHLAMMLAVGDDGDSLGTPDPIADGSPAPSGKVRAAVSIVGPAMLDGESVPAISRSIVDGFIGGDDEGRAERCAKASPITYVTKDDAPILMFLGTKDPLVPASQATKMAEAMSAAGVPGRVELLIGAGHGWGGEELKRTLNASAEFFDRVFAAKK